ncbi:MAG: RNA pyrophosphohydrolase [Alphaproteobacteria bacterium]|nr:MAG: RNA pyrophosphohydrolase [Alphaproteobacteria bacterium]
MTEPKDPTRYRPNVGLALFHKNGLVFLAKRIATEGPYQWQMPQGGVDRGEKPLEAAIRELEEEIGVREEHVDLLEETADWFYYEFPIDVRTKMKPRGRYLGQRQKWFAFRFKGRDADIRLDTHTPEFVDWRWATLESAPALVIPFKRPTYEQVAQRFKKYSVGART